MTSVSNLETRFSGNDGKANMLEALLQQSLIGGSKDIASKICDKGVPLLYKHGDAIITQGEGDNELYFVLSGEVDIFINHQHIITRKAGIAVGEMAAIDPSAVRSATVKAASPEVIVCQLAASDFVELCETNGRLSLAVARMAAERLRERSRFHIPANKIPKLFIGSSGEAVRIAEAISDALPSDSVEARPWTTKGIFSPSGFPLDELIDELDQTDFALFVFAPDDKIKSRRRTKKGARDNVVFEMGLFIGRISRPRVFMLLREGDDLKIPSDLLGLNQLRYKHRRKEQLATAIGPACDELMRLIEQHGVIRNRMRHVESAR